MEANAGYAGQNTTNGVSETSGIKIKRVKPARFPIRGFDVFISVCALPKDFLAEQEWKMSDLDVWYSCRQGFSLENFRRLDDVVDFVKGRLNAKDTRVYIGPSRVCFPISEPLIYCAEYYVRGIYEGVKIGLGVNSRIVRYMPKERNLNGGFD